VSERDDKHWSDYAMEKVAEAIRSGKTENNPRAALAAVALTKIWWEEGHHPSNYNSQFAVAVYFAKDIPEIELYAWRIVVNGLAGYWEWQSHLEGHFGLLGALRYLEIISDEEARHTERFMRKDIPGSYFVVIKPELLTRIVEQYRLPTTNANIGGKRVLSAPAIRRREDYLRHCGLSTFLEKEGRARYAAALASM